ncbi:MAG: hypothetical protein HY796_06025 [Elusimicrobia bacterium]|nr:hypothetical protein [Elusimicrobiota bacterium]
MKKIGLFFLSFTLLFAAHHVSISLAENNKNASNSPCTSDCRKAGDSGKKQSVTKRICSSLAGILTNEIGKTTNKTKSGILKGGLKYVNEVCDRGGTPDLAKITKGLPEEDKKRISQKTSSALFDGKGDLPDKDLDVNSNQTATLTGAGGWVTDLKTSEPDLNKISPVTDFSLSGTKLSGETPGQAATKQSPSLSASASSAKSLAAVASAAENQPPAEAGTIAPFDLQRKCPKPCWCDKNLYADYTTDIKVCDSKCEILCEGYSTDGGAGGSTLGKLIKRFRDWMASIYHRLKGDEKCGKAWHDPDKTCCANGTTIVTLCGGKCYDPVTEYCENDTICENTCSAGVISASPAPTNGEVAVGIRRKGRAISVVVKQWAIKSFVR